MPFNIPSGYQSFSAGGNQARNQFWAFVPQNISVHSSLHILQAQPQDQDVSITIRDILSSSFSSSHNNFKLLVTLLQDVYAPDLFEISSATHSIDSAILLDSSVSLNMVITVSFVNPTILLEGRYNGFISFSIVGTNNVTSLEEELDLRVYSLTLERLGSTTNLLTPRTMNFAYVQGGVSPVVNFDVIPAPRRNSINYQLSHENDVIVNIPTAIASSNPPYTLLQGDDVASGTLALNTSIWDTMSLGMHDTVFNVYFSDWQVILGVDVNVAVLDVPGAFVSPSVLEFGTTVPENPQAQFIDIFSTNGFSIVAPSWLQISDLIGSGSARVNVVPIDVSNFTRGEYRDVITVTASGIDYIIDVYFQVNDQLGGNVSVDNINFTKDLAFYSIDGYDTNHYMEVRTYGLAYCQNGDYINIDHKSIVPFFKASASFIPGPNIDRLIPLFGDLSGNLLDTHTTSSLREYYNQVAVIAFDIKVIDRRTGEARFERTTARTKWLKGTKPLNNSSNRASLVYDFKTARIDALGLYVYNFYTQEASVIKVLKNGVEIESVTTSGGDFPVGRIVIKGSDYLLGDVIEFKLIDPTTAATSSEYVLIYPVEDYSYHVAYLTEYNTIDIIQCRGSIAAAGNYTRRTNTLLKNGVDVINHVDVTRGDNIVLNTGFVPKDQTVMVDMLKRSTRAWLLFPDIEAIPMAVISSEINGHDSEKFLYSYEVEVKLNRKVDAQIHTF